MTKILFTGITGLLGKYFLNKKPIGFEIIGTYNTHIPKKIGNSFKLNISDSQEVNSFINNARPNIVIHAASIGNVDYCESHKEEAYKINIEGTQNVLNASLRVNAKFIFTSSNAIYDGENSPYGEGFLVNPLDVYGKTKVEGEKIIKKSNIPYTILRLMTMYGWPQEGGRSNPVTWVIEQLKNKKQIYVVNDIYNNHLFAGQAAEVIWKIIEDGKDKETYNIAGKECISRFELALKVCKVFDLDPSLINPVKSDYFKNIAPRPKNTCFDTNKIEKEFDIKPLGIIEGLKKMRDEES